MIIVYSHTITERVAYIFRTIFEDVLNVQVSFTNDVSFFTQSNLPKINYSTQAIENSLFFPATHLLFEKGVKEQKIEVFEDQLHQKVFFKVEKGSCFSFDMFAASFYLITRYEEYLPHKTDKHGRFLASESLAFKHSFIKVPIINYWINHLERCIKDKYSDFQFPERKFNYLSTIDIDNAYAIQHKGFLRTVGGIAKATFSRNKLKQRLNVLVKKEKDPYDTFAYLENFHQQQKIKPIYFFLVGDYAEYDKNCDIENESFQQLIKNLVVENEIGIHPSYQSNEANDKLLLEKNRLENVINKTILKSRQHYLKLTFPTTYRRLLKAGITMDYTMGYAETIGFRASIAHPFFFYDIENEQATKLKITPFCVMEATFLYYENKTPEQALKEIYQLIDEVKKVKGTFVSVWHNESLSDEGIWKGWKDVYEKMIFGTVNNKNI
ncbi:MAG: polysaccharide deacetylase family protein [Vicingaceae bacterium]|nr:polysaccharide deacetylase family protein [Vicingaceae bacterium]